MDPIHPLEPRPPWIPPVAPPRPERGAGERRKGDARRKPTEEHRARPHRETAPAEPGAHTEQSAGRPEDDEDEHRHIDVRA